MKAFRKRLRVFAFALVVIAALYIIGVSLARQFNPHPSALALASTRPAQLETAADYLALGDYEFDRGDYDRAVADYTHALELNPQFAEAYNNRAYTYMKLENYVLALPDLDRAIELRPNYVNALMNRGDIYNYYYAIDRQRAIADYDRVLASDPNAIKTTSVCGHRAIAWSGGMNPVLLLTAITGGNEAVCNIGSVAP